MWLEVLNTLTVSYLGTECALRGIAGVSWRQACAVVAANVLLNAACWVAALRWKPLAELLPPALIEGLLVLVAAGSGGAAAWHQRRWLAERIGVLAAGLPGVGRRAPLAVAGAASALAAAALLGAALLGVLRQAVRLDRQGIVVHRKVLLASIAYPLACYLDVRRHDRAIRLRDFLAYVAWALLATAMLFVPLSMAVAVVMLVLVSLLEDVHMDPHFLSWPIYYGVLYGPFATFYWHVKRQALGKGRRHILLPM